MSTELDLTAISGEIENTLTGSSLNPSDLSRIQLMKQWFNEKKSHLKPWGDFLNSRKMSKPNHIGDVTKRVITNVKLYQANYIFICMLLAVYCVLTSPLLLFGLAMSVGGCSYIRSRGNGQPIVVFGKSFTVTEQYGLVFLISLPLFFLASAGSTVFWIIGASIFIIMVHASLLGVEGPGNDIEMESISVQ